MEAQDGPPGTGTAQEVIEVSTPSLLTDTHMEEMFTGKKHNRGRDSESEEDDVANGPTTDEASKTSAEPGTETENSGWGRENTERGSAAQQDQEENKTEDDEQEEEGATDPRPFELEEPTPLTFNEMYSFLHEEVAGKPQQQVQEVNSAQSFLDSMFEQVFKTYPAEALPEDKCQYPELNDEEKELLLRLLTTDAKGGRADARSWRARLYDVVRAIYRSNWTLSAILDHRITKAQASNGRPVSNPWVQRQSQQNVTADGDIDMSPDGTSTFKFFMAAYTKDEIKQLRQLCEIQYGFPTMIRKPTANEQKVIKGLLEGTILCSDLPAFLKRVCTNEALRMIQNTIQAQVEGDLVLQLHQDFPVYPDFQTRDRLISMILLRPENGHHDKAKLVELLQDTKQVCYDRSNHAVHLIFWTREQASNWNKTFTTLPFRNKVFKLQNEHPEVATETLDDTIRGDSVWARQIGPDGVRNEKSRDRYHIRLLNVSRFMNEAAIDEYIKQNFGGKYTTWQEPTTRNNQRQTDTWEIYFKTAVCPAFLAGQRFIDWDGTKILIHHVSVKPTPPCFQCGVSGHTRLRCNADEAFWKTSECCLKVRAEDIATLPIQNSTVTSLDELAKYWIDEEKEPLPTRIIPPRPTTKLEETKIEPRMITKSSQEQEVEGDEWKTAGNKKGLAAAKMKETMAGQTPTVPSGQRNIPPRGETTRTTGTDATTTSTRTIEAITAVTQNNQNQHTIGEEIRMKLSIRSQVMEKQINLINNHIRKKRKPAPKSSTGPLAKLNVERFTATPKNAREVLQAIGLETVQTPMNGNCQYYALAMALLYRDFSQVSNPADLELLAAKLKRGMAAAAGHFFNEEFPHETRLLLLSRITKSALDYSEKQSEQALKAYFTELSKSNSQQDGFIDERLWGTDETLRLTSKLLQRKIFTVVARPSLEQATYSIYAPKQIKKYGKQFSSAAERLIRANEPGKWLQELKQERNKLADSGETPLVIIFRPAHYEWLRFNPTAARETTVHTTILNEAMEIDEETKETTDHGEMDVDENTKETNEKETTVCTAIDDSNEVSENDSEQEQQEHEGEHDQELTQNPAQFGRAKQDRVEQLVVFSDDGINRISQGKRSELYNMDWSNETLVADWMSNYEISKPTLQQWQLDLIAIGSQPTLTPSEPSSQILQESEWQDEQEDTHNTPEQTERPLPLTTGREGRFQADTITQTTSTRISAQQVNKQWNDRQPAWKLLTTCPFPNLPAKTALWRETVERAPEVLVGMLTSYERPGDILSDMTDSVLETWTLTARLDCQLHCLTMLAGSVADENQRQWLLDCCRDFRQQADNDITALNLHPRELWTRVKHWKYGDMELLKLCRKEQTQILSRLIITSTIYGAEMIMIKPTNTQIPTSTMERLAILFAVMESRPELQALLHRKDSAGLWTELETRLTESPQAQQVEEDGQDGQDGSASPDY